MCNFISVSIYFETLALTLVISGYRVLFDAIMNHNYLQYEPFLMIACIALSMTNPVPCAPPYQYTFFNGFSDQQYNVVFYTWHKVELWDHAEHTGFQQVAA